MLNVRRGDRVQVRRDKDEGLALTGLRTPPGTVTGVRGTGMDARIMVQLDEHGGQVMAYKPAELELVVLEACE